jgi:hypothetical protein
MIMTSKITSYKAAITRIFKLANFHYELSDLQHAIGGDPNLDAEDIEELDILIARKRAAALRRQSKPRKRRRRR